MSKHTFVLTFRGELVRQFTSVYDVQAVLLGYRRYPARGQAWTEAPKGQVARKPEVLRQMKTVAALKRDGVPPKFDTYPGQTFMIVVRPGTTEITDDTTEIVER